MISTAIILAAGLGSRLKNVLSDKPKGFIKIENTSLIDRSISLLNNYGVKYIYIVTGHLSEFYESLNYNNIKCIKNELYFETGSFFSLLSAYEYLNDDFLILESDLLYERLALEKIINHKEENVILASNQTNSNDEVFIESDNYNYMINISKDREKLNSIYAELVGINKISMNTLISLYKWSLLNKEKSYRCHYEEAFAEIKTDKFYIEKIENLVWTEIDSPQHLHIATNKIYPRIKNDEMLNEPN